MTPGFDIAKLFVQDTYTRNHLAQLINREIKEAYQDAAKIAMIWGDDDTVSAATAIRDAILKRGKEVLGE